MVLKSSLKKILLNRTIPKEYLCVIKEKYEGSVRVFMQSGENVVEVTENHSMLGYRPLIILINTMPFKSGNKLPEQILLSFRTNKEFEIAQLRLKKIMDCKLGSFRYYV